MEQFFRRLSLRINQLNERVGQAVSWLTTALVGLVCFDVVTRYLVNDTKIWIMELEWHLFALIFLLGAGYALKHDRHVRVDLFYARFSKRDQALVDLVGTLVLLIPWCLLLIVVSTRYAVTSYLDGETSADPGGLPARFIIKSSISLGIFLLLLQAVAQAIDAVFILRERGESNKD